MFDMKKTKMVWLLDGEKNFDDIRLAVSTQYLRV